MLFHLWDVQRDLSEKAGEEIVVCLRAYCFVADVSLSVNELEHLSQPSDDVYSDRAVSRGDDSKHVRERNGACIYAIVCSIKLCIKRNIPNLFVFL